MLVFKQLFIFCSIVKTIVSFSGKNKKKSKTSNKKKSRPIAREITCYQGYATLCAGYFKVGQLNIFKTKLKE